MSTVQTVLGAIDSSELGTTLMHEHIRISWDGWDKDSTVTFNREEELARAADRLAELKSLGISTFVDAAPIDLGRNVEFLAEVSQRSGVNIICAVGLYHTEHGFPGYFRLRDVDELAEIYAKELNDGVGNTGIRPGLIKCATPSHEIGEHEEKALRAAARAHLATGAPIYTHTTEGKLGPQQVEIFLSEGVDPRAFSIGHCCWNSDLRYHLGILKNGCHIGIDQIGLTYLMPDEVRLAIVATLCRMGYAGQLFMSQDHVSCYPGRFIKLPPEIMEVLSKRTYTYLLKTFIPRLRDEWGVPDDTITQIMRDNPRRFFEEARAVAKAGQTHGAASGGN